MIPRLRPRGLAEKLTSSLAQVLEHAAEAEALGARDGLLQGLDPRAKLVATAAPIISDKNVSEAASPCSTLFSAPSS